MAKKTVADAAKAKQAKQKKIVILLGAVFALAMVYAFMTISGMQSGGGQKPMAAPPPTAGSATSTTPSTTPTAAPTLAGSTPAASTSSTSSTSSSTSTTTDSSALVAVVTPPMDPGQLQSFGRFASKDPFDSSGPGTTKSSGSSSSSGGSSGSGGSGGSGGSTPKTPPPPPAAPATQAVISVNGTQESVTAGSNFPSTNPIFLLVSVTSTSAKVAIAGGSYSTGQPTLTLSVNKPVTLVNTADGTRYTLILMPQGTAVAPSSSSSSSYSGNGSTAPPVSTTPTTTSPTGP